MRLLPPALLLPPAFLLPLLLVQSPRSRSIRAAAEVRGMVMPPRKEAAVPLRLAAAKAEAKPPARPAGAGVA